MSIIGNFTYDAETDVYRGYVSSLTIDRVSVELRPNKKSAEKEPDYRVLAHESFGFVELGAAWKRTNELRQEFLSVSIDDPALPGSLNAKLSMAKDGESATLVWIRPKAKSQPKAEPKAEAA